MYQHTHWCLHFSDLAEMVLPGQRHRSEKGHRGFAARALACAATPRFPLSPFGAIEAVGASPHCQAWAGALCPWVPGPWFPSCSLLSQSRAWCHCLAVLRTWALDLQVTPSGIPFCVCWGHSWEGQGPVPKGLCHGQVLSAWPGTEPPSLLFQWLISQQVSFRG